MEVDSRVGALGDSPERRGFSLGSRCSCCQAAEESLLHIFVTGSVAKEVRDHFQR